MEHHITQYDLEQGALEIQYIEEFFGEFPRKKTAAEIVRRLNGRSHLILLANAPLPDDPGSVVPVSFKVAHEIRESEPADAKLADLVTRLEDHVAFNGRRVLYTWIGGTRRDWRGQGHFRALTEQQELWAISAGVRRDRRQDEEQVLRYARHARSPPVRGGQIRTQPVRQRAVEGVFEQEAVGGGPRRAPQREDRGAGAGITMAPTTNYSKDLGDREPLAAMRDSVPRLADLTRAWSAADFERQYAPGKWTARQVLIHLAQTELALGVRARMALATADYTAQPFDQDIWLRRETRLSGPDAVAALVALSRMNVELFETLSPAERETAMAPPGVRLDHGRLDHLHDRRPPDSPPRPARRPAAFLIHLIPNS